MRRWAGMEGGNHGEGTKTEVGVALPCPALHMYYHLHSTPTLSLSLKWADFSAHHPNKKQCTAFWQLPHDCFSPFFFFLFSSEINPGSTSSSRSSSTKTTPIHTVRAPKAFCLFLPPSPPPPFPKIKKETGCLCRQIVGLGWVHTRIKRGGEEEDNLLVTISALVFFIFGFPGFSWYLVREAQRPLCSCCSLCLLHFSSSSASEVSEWERGSMRCHRRHWRLSPPPPPPPASSSCWCWCWCWAARCRPMGGLTGRRRRRPRLLLDRGLHRRRRHRGLFPLLRLRLPEVEVEVEVEVEASSPRMAASPWLPPPPPPPPRWRLLLPWVGWRLLQLDQRLRFLFSFFFLFCLCVLVSCRIAEFCVLWLIFLKKFREKFYRCFLHPFLRNSRADLVGNPCCFFWRYGVKSAPLGSFGFFQVWTKRITLSAVSWTWVRIGIEYMCSFFLVWWTLPNLGKETKKCILSKGKKRNKRCSNIFASKFGCRKEKLLFLSFFFNLGGSPNFVHKKFYLKNSKAFLLQMSSWPSSCSSSRIGSLKHLRVL